MNEILFRGEIKVSGFTLKLSEFIGHRSKEPIANIYIADTTNGVVLSPREATLLGEALLAIADRGEAYETTGKLTESMPGV